MTEALIDLTREPERGAPALTDRAGVAHYYADPDDFSLVDQATVRRLSRRAEVLDALDRPSAKQAREYEDTMVELVAMVLPTLDTETNRSLSKGQRDALYMGFLVHTGAVSMMSRVLTSTGASTSPASSGSTAPTRSGG